MSGERVAAASNASDGDVDLGRVLRAVRARWLWCALPTLVALIGSAILVNLLTPSYTAETRLLLESGESFYTRPAADGGGVAQIDSEAVASQVQIITSRDLARDAVKRLQLVGNPEFDPLVAGMGPLQRFLTLVGLARQPDNRAPEDRVLSAFFDRLQVYAAGRSRVVVIEFQSRDPDLAARAANTVAELFLERQEAAKKETARLASLWLASTIEPLRQRVAEAEGRVEAFRSSAGLFATGTTTITSQQMADLSAQLASARAAQAESQAKAKLIRELLKTGRTVEIPDVANNELIRRLNEQRATLRAQLALEQRTLLPDHPRIKELNAQLADLERELRSSAERTVRTLEAESEIAGSRVESLSAALDAQKRQVAASSESEVQLRALEREAKTQRDQLESYLAKFREATARDAENATPADGRIVSRAVSPLQPSFPKKTPIILLATLATLILSLGTIVSIELLAAPAIPLAAVAANPAASTLPETRVLVAEAMPHDYASGRPLPPELSPDQPPASGLENARPSLADILSTPPVTGRGRRVVLVCASKTADAALRAVALEAADGRRAVLVNLMPVAKESAEWGFTDLVAGDAGFLDVIVRERGVRLHRIGLGTGEPVEIAGDIEAVEVALTALEQTYDLVLVAIAASDLSSLEQVFKGRVDNAVALADVPEDAAKRIARLASGGAITMDAKGETAALEPA